MNEVSPRSTAPNQMLARSPTRTSPASTAVSARNTSAPIVGAIPSSSMIVAIGVRSPERSLTTSRRDYTMASVSQVSHFGASSVVATEIEQLAPLTEDEVRAHLKAGRLVEGLQHM